MEFSFLDHTHSTELSREEGTHFILFHSLNPERFLFCYYSVHKDDKSGKKINKIHTHRKKEGIGKLTDYTLYQRD